MDLLRYEEGEECPECLVIHFTVAQWSSLTVRETIQRAGAKIVEGIISTTDTLYSWGHSLPHYFLIIFSGHPLSLGNKLS